MVLSRPSETVEYDHLNIANQSPLLCHGKELLICASLKVNSLEKGLYVQRINKQRKSAF